MFKLQMKNIMTQFPYTDILQENINNIVNVCCQTIRKRISNKGLITTNTNYTKITLAQGKQQVCKKGKIAKQSKANRVTKHT